MTRALLPRRALLLLLFLLSYLRRRLVNAVLTPRRFGIASRGEGDPTLLKLTREALEFSARRREALCFGEFLGGLLPR